MVILWISTLHAFATTPSTTVKTLGQTGQSQSAPQEIAALQTAANSGDATVQLKLAQAYESGNGVPKDLEKAVAWYRKVADQGNAEAENNLGVMYRLGEGLEENKQLAVEW